MSNIKLSDALAGDGKELSKQTSIVNLIIANAFIIGGIVLFIIGAAQTALILGGLAALAIGIFICIKYSVKTVYNATGCTVRERSRYVRYNQMTDVADFLKSAGVACNVKLDGSGEIRLDIVATTDGKFIRGMFFQYVPYSYVPISEPFGLTADNVQKLFELIDK
ncbi:MAG: hypothetical protein J6Y82_01040 [Bacteroidales bacterium]|nr:hypothetical protein [Bacteroidales bacterium]